MPIITFLCLAYLQTIYNPFHIEFQTIIVQIRLQNEIEIKNPHDEGYISIIIKKVKPKKR